MKIDQPVHHLENVLEISERLPFLGAIVDALLPDDSPGLTSHVLLQVARGERFDDLEALKEVNKLYGAMLGELRAYVYQHRTTGMRQEALQYVMEAYQRTGVIQVERDTAFEWDLKQHVDFHQKTYDSVAHIPDIHCQFHDSTIVTTCFLPRPAERSPKGAAFPRCKVNLSPAEREGHKLAYEIGLLGNPVIRATLSLLG